MLYIGGAGYSILYIVYYNFLIFLNIENIKLKLFVTIFNVTKH